MKIFGVVLLFTVFGFCMGLDMGNTNGYYKGKKEVFSYISSCTPYGEAKVTDPSWKLFLCIYKKEMGL